MRTQRLAAAAFAAALACVAQAAAVADAPHRGTKGPDRVHLGKADDRYAARGGDDRVWGGRGDDRISGGSGDDRLVGEGGRDRLKGGSGFDVCIADPGDVDLVRGCEVVRPPATEEPDGSAPPPPADGPDVPPAPEPEPDPEAEAQPEYSDAYLNRNWTPTPYDTCPKALHDSYSVIGPDGKLYPGWHPPTVIDPATGQRCTFGHEHGADPSGSDLSDWVGPIPFGYASERLAEYAATNPGTATRFEDHVGHKVDFANDVTLLDTDGHYVTAPDPAGSGAVRVVCDYLTKVHQGSHSADATTNNAHELLYAVRCNDGTELLSTTMARFGDANEFNRSCAPSSGVDTGSSSPLPDGDGGVRLIADRACVEQYVLVPPTNPGAQSDIWALYENWQAESALRTAGGETIASFDPWFAVRNPSRYYNPAGVLGRTLAAAWETDPTDGGVANRSPWTDVQALSPFEFRDPRSPFDGAQREFYLGRTELTNAGAQRRWYTDPYGENGSPQPFPGAICQIVSTTDNSAYPELKRRLFGRDDDYGSGNGVHAPN